MSLKNVQKLCGPSGLEILQSLEIAQIQKLMSIFNGATFCRLNFFQKPTKRIPIKTLTSGKSAES